MLGLTRTAYAAGDGGDASAAWRAMMLIQHHKASEFYERAMDQFEQIYKDAKGSARVMAISVHPYIMGAPHRAKYFRKIFQKIRKKKDVLFWTGAQIADWYRKVGPKAP